jgi:hypothetical protein
MHEIEGRHDCDRADVAGSARALRVPPGSADGVDQAAYAAFGEVGVAGGGMAGIGIAAGFNTRNVVGGWLLSRRDA